MSEPNRVVSTTTSPKQDLKTLLPTFTITAPPNTDLYATPQKGHITTAPIHYTIISTKSFKSIAVTISLPYAHLYDQAGLVLLLPHPSDPHPDLSAPILAEKAPQWIKAGIECNDGLPQLSVVECEKWADWSLGLLPSTAIDGEAKVARYRIKLERAGHALKVWAVDEDIKEGEGQQQRLIRKMQWVFLDENEEMWVGAYACRPAKGVEVGGKDQVGGKDLVVRLKDLVIGTV